MDNANFVANELYSVGFRTKVITSNGVLVSLTSRKVGIMEVEGALDKIFDGEIEFQYQATSSGVLVTW